MKTEEFLILDFGLWIDGLLRGRVDAAFGNQNSKFKIQKLNHGGRA
jgi:hypothetical protein